MNSFKFMRDPSLRWHIHLNHVELTLAKVSQKTSLRRLERMVRERFLGASMEVTVTCADKLCELPNCVDGFVIEQIKNLSRYGVLVGV